jgi:hypothetical protein
LRFVVLRLVPHPDTPSGAVEDIEARVERASSHLRIAYTLRGNLDAIRVPAPRPEKFADGLWKHTCFEAFIGWAHGYREYNFAPSGEFAAYAFEAYRAGMRVLQETPRLTVQKTRGSLRLEALVPDAGSGRLGLCAVVEAADGALSYWALTHPPGRPDFHRAAAFTLDLDEIRN